LQNAVICRSSSKMRKELGNNFVALERCRLYGNKSLIQFGATAKVQSMSRTSPFAAFAKRYVVAERLH
jgi:hypothetical protein